MTKTKEEIQALKENWSKDPNWDIEDTEGFEDHEEELIAFRKEKEVEWEIRAEEKRRRRANVVQVETSITDAAIQQQISTFGEIKYDIICATNSESQLDMAAAQVRAILLLAAQVSRLADAVEQGN